MRRWLVVFLGVSAAVISFDALYARALTGGLIPKNPLIAPWIIAALWAFVIDGAGASGIIGIKDDPHDKRAWFMFALAACASLGFQATTPPVTWTSVLAKAVAPIALGFAIIVLELPRRTQVGEGAVREPAPSPKSAAEPVEAGPMKFAPPTPPTGRTARKVPASKRTQARELIVAGESNRAIAEQLRTDQGAVANLRDELAREGNGSTHERVHA